MCVRDGDKMASRLLELWWLLGYTVKYPGRGERGAQYIYTDYPTQTTSTVLGHPRRAASCRLVKMGGKSALGLADVGLQLRGSATRTSVCDHARLFGSTSCRETPLQFAACLVFSYKSPQWPTCQPNTAGMPGGQRPMPAWAILVSCSGVFAMLPYTAVLFSRRPGTDGNPEKRKMALPTAN